MKIYSSAVGRSEDKTKFSSAQMPFDEVLAYKTRLILWIERDF